MSETTTTLKNDTIPTTLSMDNRLEIIEEGIRKKYLTRLTDLQIASFKNMPDLEKDLIDNIRIYHIKEMVYQKGESATDKFTTVFNTLATYSASVFIILDSNGSKTDFYIGVRNNETEGLMKRSTVTLGDTLKNTLTGHFPGLKLENEERNQIKELSEKICSQHNVTSVSVVGSKKILSDRVTNEEFVQGLEKLALAMDGRQYIGIIIAENQSAAQMQLRRKEYQNLYTQLSPLQKVQFSRNDSESVSKAKSFAEMDGKQKAAMIAGALASVSGVVGGAALGAAYTDISPIIGSSIGGQIGGQLNGFIASLAPSEQITKSFSDSVTSTTENKAVTDLLKLLDDELKRIDDFDNYGMWNTAGYFISDDMSAAEIAASNYRSLMNGETSGREVSAINSWRSNPPFGNIAYNQNKDYKNLTEFLSRFMHPQFCYGEIEGRTVYTDATTSISGKELGIHLGLPRATVSGLPVIEHAEFGKEVNTYSLFSDDSALNPEERMTIGHVFDLGHPTNRIVELKNKSLNMHTFITGSTGSGKSNAVYQILTELHQDKIPFLVVEPAKGEYKDVFGSWEDVNIYSTNPNIAEMININPFMFPDSIHVLEHVDGLVEIFSVCWPMYDAMSAFFKESILKSYEAVGWDLGSSTFYGDTPEYPDFEVLSSQLSNLIGQSDYADEIKSNYRGALLTRVNSLTVGLNRFIFTHNQTEYSKLFDENCILDISRVKSGETKALLMGLMVYMLNEYRMDQKTTNNNGLKHITVLEEAHNLLKNTMTGQASELIGKSVEMLTQTIAEIRTYGEGFIIVDQSPSSVDIAAIKNTNTKIVLRTPEAHDREAIGRSIGLNEDQVNEIAKLPGGVAVVYQNDWVSPVLTLIEKANVTERPYVNNNPQSIKPIKVARFEIICYLLQSWRKKKPVHKKALLESLTVLNLSRETKKQLESLIKDYRNRAGLVYWGNITIDQLRLYVTEVLNINEKQFSLLTQKKDIIQLSCEVSKTLSDWDYSQDKPREVSDGDIELILNFLNNGVTKHE